MGNVLETRLRLSHLINRGRSLWITQKAARLSHQQPLSSGVMLADPTYL